MSETPFLGTFAIDRVHSSVLVAVQLMRLTEFRAWFSDFDGVVEGDGPSVRLRGSAPVKALSISEPPEFRQHVVDGADFLDGNRHPEIAFVSSEIEFKHDGTVDVAGSLSMRGAARPVRGSGTYRQPEEDPFGRIRGAMSLDATVDRREWGMDWQQNLPSGAVFLGCEVRISAALILVPDGSQGG